MTNDCSALFSKDLQEGAIEVAAAALVLNPKLEARVMKRRYLTCRNRPCRWMNFTVPDLPLTRPAAMSTMSPTPICFRVASCAAAQPFLESETPI